MQIINHVIGILLLLYGLGHFCQSFADSRCQELLSLSKEATAFFESLELPIEVLSFLDSNPAYTNYLHGYSSRQHAYFSGRVYKDWLLIKDHLPDIESPSVLDIGSGIGGIDILIARNYSGSKLTLVDKAEKDGFNVIEMAQSLIQQNTNGAELSVLELGDPKIKMRKYDIVTSFRALAYLFPYETYRSLILSNLNVGGVLILDLSVRSIGLETSEVILGRFDGQSSGSRYESILQDIRETIGEPEIITRNHSYHRIIVKRRIP